MFHLLLIIRSSLDIFTDVGLHFGPILVNVPSIIAILILVGGWLYLISKTKILIPKILMIFGLWLIVLIPFVLLSVVNFGTQGLIALREWIRLSSILAVFFLSFNMVKNVEKSINLLFISLIVPLTMGFYQLIMHTGIIETGIHRTYGTLAHPNSFALYLVLFIALTYRKLDSTNHKFLIFLLLLAEIGFLISTVSFTGYIMFAVVFIMLASKAKTKRKIVLFCLIGIFALSLLNSGMFLKRWERIRSINFKQALEEREVVESLTWRIANWYNLVSVWQEKPLLGYGLHTTYLVNPWKVPGTQSGYDPHNDFVRYLVETGLVGLLFYIIFIVYLGINIYKNYKLCKNPQIKSLLYICLIVFIAWQIGSLTGSCIGATAFQFYFWAVCGMALRFRNAQKI
jgi:O-antigen ligase